MIYTYNEMMVKDWNSIFEFAQNEYEFEHLLENMFTMRDLWGNTLFTTAIYAKKFDLAKYLIKKGSNVNAIIANLGGNSALTYLAASDEFEMLMYLLEHGANIHFKTNIGVTALHLAAASGHLRNVKLFIEKGADVNAKDKGGLTPIEYAMDPHKRKDVVEYLTQIIERTK